MKNLRCIRRQDFSIEINLVTLSTHMDSQSHTTRCMQISLDARSLLEIIQWIPCNDFLFIAVLVNARKE